MAGERNSKEDNMYGKRAFTLVELLVVVMILGALAAIAVPRMISGATNAKIHACETNVDLLNSQIELYYANKESWPSKLTDVTEDEDYFPDGAPECPFGTEYKYSTTSHRVSAHTH
jgi:prepilin-type N-terminal cleavage/methylation domain-containing protein